MYLLEFKMCVITGNGSRVTQNFFKWNNKEIFWLIGWLIGFHVRLKLQSGLLLMFLESYIKVVPTHNMSKICHDNLGPLRRGRLFYFGNSAICFRSWTLIEDKDYWRWNIVTPSVNWINPQQSTLCLISWEIWLFKVLIDVSMVFHCSCSNGNRADWLVHR